MMPSASAIGQIDDQRNRPDKPEVTMGKRMAANSDLSPCYIRATSVIHFLPSPHHVTTAL